MEGRRCVPRGAQRARARVGRTSACASSDSSSSQAGGSTTTASSSASGGDMAQWQAKLDTLYKNTFHAPHTDGSPVHKRDRSGNPAVPLPSIRERRLLNAAEADEYSIAAAARLNGLDVVGR